MITLQRSEEFREIEMFHFQHWPDHGVPKDCRKLLSLISKVEKSQQQQNENQPVVIICRYLEANFPLLSLPLTSILTTKRAIFARLSGSLGIVKYSISGLLYWVVWHTVTEDNFASSS